jgi:replication-associated recombination protein RarA
MRLKGNNIIDVDPDRNAIKRAVTEQIEHGHYKSEFLYGDGGAGKAIADVLSRTSLATTQKINIY